MKMRVEQKSNVKNSIGRLTFAGLALLFQIIWFMLMGLLLSSYSTLIYTLVSALALFVAIMMYRKTSNSEMRISWLIVILSFPALGLILYLLLGRPNTTKGMRQRYEQIDRVVYKYIKQDDTVFEQIEKEDISIANQMRYIKDYARFPAYKNEGIEYYDDALAGFNAQLEALEKAEKFIFMEYHAIEDEESYARLHEILVRKAREGLDVRILYDDMGSIFFINRDFNEKLEREGIKCKAFNPVVPILKMFMNNRDHRKITIIDGKIGFTGGYNLANEYFNIVNPYGHWKDTGIKIKGAAVNNFTAMFLEMWNATEREDVDMSKFFVDEKSFPDKEGYIQPYGDSPLDGEHVGENVYLNMIKNAKRYVYIVTPYLIITDEMNHELGLAAKRGVDVRIVTPGIPDKKVVYQVTRSYYSDLVANGVRIYEYTPGFCHAKMTICDDEIATVGTINYDYRSLYHHFEDGCLIYKCNVLDRIRDDFYSMFEVSSEVTENYRAKSQYLRIEQCALRIIAPLL